MIRTWSPPSCRSRPRWPRSGRCCPRRAPGSTSTPGPRGRCRPRPSARWTSRRSASSRSAAASPTCCSRSWSAWAEARAAVAAVLVADPDDVALTHCADRRAQPRWSTRSPGRPGDRVLTTRHEHPGGLGPLLALRERLGVEVEFVDVGDGGDDERTIAAFAAALERPARADRREPRPVDDGRRAADPAGSGELARSRGRGHDRRRGAGRRRDPGLRGGPGGGRLRHPGSEVAARARGHGRPVGAPRPRRLVVPAHAAYLSYEMFDPQRPVLQAGARRFEATGFHRPSVVGLARSCGWLSMYVGLPWAQERADPPRGRGGRPPRRRSPASRCVTPRGAMATLVTFRIAGWPAAAAVEELGSRAFAILARPADDRRPPDLGGLLDHRGGARPVRRRRRAAGRATRPRRSRRAARSTILGSDDRPARLTAARAVGGPAARLVRGPLAPVPPRPAAGVPRGRDEPDRRDRARARVPRLRRRPRPRRAPPGRRPAAAVPDGLRGDRARGGRADHLARRPAAHRDRGRGARRGRRGAPRSACSPRSRSPTSCSSCSTRS